METPLNSLSKQIKNYIYTTDAKIGKGFSSIVYKGNNKNTNQQVAIKVIDLKSIKNDVQRMLLSNQMKALKCMEHQNTLKTFQICQTANNVYIISQFCQQGDLQSFIKNKGKFSQDQALKIFQQIVNGVHHIHSKGIIHRDIKSANVLLKNNCVKIGDFGFAQFIKQNKGQSFYNVGSPLYMSPQAYRKTKYSVKSDCWAIGVILYQLFIGQQPFKGIDYDTMLRHISSGQIYKNINVSGFIKMLLSRLLSIDIQRRVQTGQLINLLKSNQPKLISQGPLGRPLSRIQLRQPLVYMPETIQNQFKTTMTKFNDHNESKQNNPNGYFGSLQRRTTHNILQTTTNGGLNKLDQIQKIQKMNPIKMFKKKSYLNSKIQQNDFLMKLCISLNQFKTKYSLLVRVYYLCLQHYRNMTNTLQQVLGTNQQSEMYPRFKQFKNKLEDFLILADFEQIKQDPFFSYLIKNIKPANQTYYTYTQFWLKDTLSNLNNFLEENQQIEDYEFEQIYKIYGYCIKYYQMLQILKNAYKGTIQVRQNKVNFEGLQKLINENKSNRDKQSFKKLEDFARSVIKV